MGMIYDGQDMSTILTVEEITRPLMPEINLTMNTYDGVDGGTFICSNVGPAEIKVRVRLFGRVAGWKNQRLALEEKRRKIASMLYRREPRPLSFSEAPDIYYMALLSDAGELEHVSHTKSAELTFTCPEPAGYGARRHVSFTGDKTLLVSGNYPTYPTIKVNTSNYSTSVTLDGEPLRTTGNYASSEPFVFDCSAETCTRGSFDVAVNVFDDFFRLSPGTHEIVCADECSIEWVERWM